MTKKYLIPITVSAFAVIILAILCLIVKSFFINVILHISLRFLCVPTIIVIIQRCFKEQLPHSMKKTLVLCGIALALDLVVIDAVRFILSGGISTVLFLPACIPICFMVISLLSARDSGKVENEKPTFIIGIPLLLLSVYFEIYSFITVL